MQPRVIDTPARCASGCTASSTLDSSGAIATGPNVTSSGRTNFRKPWMRSSRRRISCPMTSTCVRRRLARRELLLQQLEVNRHRVERVLHLVRDAGGEPADHGNAARQLGELRRLDALRRRRPQLRADLIEHIAQLAELRVVAQIERGAEVAAAEPRQAAADHVHRPQHELREQHRRSAPRSAARRRRRAPPAPAIVQVAPHQRRRQADADLAERRVAERHRLRPLEVAARSRRWRAAARAPFSAISVVQLRPRAAPSVPTCAGSLDAITVPGRIDDRRRRSTSCGIERRLQRRLDVAAGADVVVGGFRRGDRDSPPAR